MAFNIRSTDRESTLGVKLSRLREAVDEKELLTFSELLYKRAPKEFIEIRSVASLRETATEVFEFFEEHIKSGNGASIKVLNPKDELRRQSTILMTAVEDRPFIVDSLSELLRVGNYRSTVLLHPIVINEAGGNTSVAYIELEQIGDSDKRAELQQKVTSLLEGVILVTDDFDKMKSQARHASSVLQDSQPEAADFLKWLAEGGFVFIGTREWTIPKNSAKQPVIVSSCSEKDEESRKGLLRSSCHQELFSCLNENVEYLVKSDFLLHFSHLPVECPVHRRSRLEAVLVICEGEDPDVSKVYCFVGLLTSQAVSQEASSVPLLRNKLKEIITKEEALPSSYDYKEIVSILDSMPKLELLQHSVETLRTDIAIILSAQHRNETRASFRFDALSRFIYALIVIPRVRLTRENRILVQAHVEKFFDAPADSAEHRIVLENEALARVHICVPASKLGETHYNIDKLEQEIAELTLTWEDRVQQQLQGSHGSLGARELTRAYLPSLPEHYRAYVSPEEAAFDIEQLSMLTLENPVRLALRPAHGQDEDTYTDLRLYRKGSVFTLSEILPLLENVGLEIGKEAFTHLNFDSGEQQSIYSFSVRRQDGKSLEDLSHPDTLLSGLTAIIEGGAEDDTLNYLLLEPGLTFRDISIVRSLQHYLWQLKLAASERVIARALTRNPLSSGLLVRYFKTRFDPNFGTEREATLKEIEEQFIESLKGVQGVTHDRILRSLLNIIDSVTRTNFFRTGEDCPRIALKIDCSKILKMPKPRPAFEIFVNAPEFSGVHLRGGKVARGGLRWSERREDYRTEVLGLMKTQMVKNSIIIPLGAKGGFVLKKKPADPTALRGKVESCYADFIRSLLEVTDNRSGNDIIPPLNTVCYDEPDPYLVVAADKGTATFSDLANSLAVEEFDFWLGDAFASGGSAGYDHKKLGITARGAWEAVCLHFREIGVDPMQEEFVVTGIGDMSGDVFGNGLLQSKHAKLIAAFNHKHIFIDPNPNPAKSFAERRRLFELPHSQWTDYNKKLISKGGAVYDRSCKEIKLSPQAKEALGTSTDVVSGQELVRIALMAPTDLLWNGGIGTYVKSTTETHLEVGDPSNDPVRVEAPQVRAKIIGEGGNLGFTQKARIEYSKLGGHINTDAVDNSGGVDLSDIEVNLKILLSGPVRRGEISLEERNSMLAQCDEEVCKKVLSRNLSQAKVLTLGVRRSRSNLGYYRGLISSFERRGILDREIECLPDDEQLSKRSELKAGLSRPALATVIAYVKMNLYDAILDSGLPEESFIEPYLTGYFPADIVARFHDEATKHPLKREIIATQVANVLVERMGATFVYRTAEETGAPIKEIIAAYLAAESILNARSISKEIAAFDRPDTMRLNIRSLLVVTDAIDLMTRWILNHPMKQFTWTELVDRFRDPFAELVTATETFVNGVDSSHFKESFSHYTANGFSEQLASKVAAAGFARSYLHIIEVAKETNRPALEIACLYFRVATELHTSSILDKAMQLPAPERWDSIANRSMRVEFRDNVARLCKNIIEEQSDTSVLAMNTYLESRLEVIERYRNSVKATQNQELTLPVLIVLTKQLAALTKPASEF